MELTHESLIDGQLILIDKPINWTSFQVVNKIRWLIKKKYINKIKVGHSGTLDPLATGLLIICTGKMTKKIPEIQALEKTYTGTITLGASTPSYDLETRIDKKFSIDHIDKDKLEVAKNKFKGEIYQIPPIYSAIKKNGRKLYEYARSGMKIKVESRKIKIHDFNLTKIYMPHVDFEVICSKGTYIRSLANDYGKTLDSGGYLSSLRRISIGDFKVKNAFSIKEIIKELNL